ncbi:4-hydroxythreonine-4-phosphate dehydrogenase PdxA [bacterium]|nr:4-hydroxythreonine-4-phosphate dehydrogenase PdxA [bacterium]
MGDPSGIGPEIIVKAFSDSNLYSRCRPLVLGDPEVLSRYLKGGTAPAIHEITRPSDATGSPGKIDLMAISRLDRDLTMPGHPTIESGKAMVQYILRAVEMAKQGDIAAMVTCPISKALMNEAGYAYEGHTQLIADLTNTKDYIMMLAGDRLRVTLVTIHCALKDVPANLDEDKIYKTIAITSKALEKDFGLQSPRVAVVALNPHAGESGLFGSEEEAFVVPAVCRAKEDGFRVEGPFPADTLFHKAASGQFDAVVAMYHDQGLIPLKLLHFADAVNITLGLPIIRTSVDHGTAYDIAGKNIADPSSLKAAIGLAVAMARNRARRGKEVTKVS